MTTCSGCTTTWTALNAAHCSGCHRTFSTAGLFDRHRRAGGCLDPATIIWQGQPLQLKDGIWKYGPRLTDPVSAVAAEEPQPNKPAWLVPPSPPVYRPGQRVRTNTPRSRAFHDLVGVVTETNLGEVGVAFAAAGKHTDAWFRPAELTHEPTR